MLAVVASMIDVVRLKKTLLSLPPSTLAVVFVGYLFGQIVSSYKWWLLARSGGIDVPYAHALKAYFIGMYINCFGFGIVGGDVARGLLITSGRQKKALGLASVVADRAHGLAILALLGIISAASFENDAIKSEFKYILYALALVIIIGWFVGPKLVLSFLKPPNKLHEIAKDLVAVFPKDPKRILYISFISACFHTIQILLHYAMAVAVGVHIPLSYLFVVIPFINTMSSLPISWQGLGVRENTYRLFLVPAFLTNEQALAWGAIWLLGLTLSSSIGGIVAVATGDIKLLNKSSIEPKPA